MHAEHHLVTELVKTESEVAQFEPTRESAEATLRAIDEYRGLDLGPVDVRLRPW